MNWRIRKVAPCDTGDLSTLTYLNAARVQLLDNGNRAWLRLAPSLGGPNRPLPPSSVWAARHVSVTVIACGMVSG